MTLPMLRLAADGQEHSVAECRAPLAEQLGISEEERRELLPSGKQPRFHNRVAWAKVYMERAGLLVKTRRGHFKITPEGLAVLENAPSRIDLPFLRRFPAFNAFQARAVADSEAVIPEDQTPEETLQAAYQKIRANLASEVLEQVKAASPEFFERLVLDLLLAMGYGGSRDAAGALTTAGADEGVDGIINEDQLGLDVIYLQAKRWEGTVGRPEIQKFVGALHGKRAKKGVFLTTSSFTSDAQQYVATIDPKVVLIDGIRLAQLMIDFNIGVSPSETYEIKRLDSDYFAEG
jgi:restriction system protein